MKQKKQNKNNNRQAKTRQHTHKNTETTQNKTKTEQNRTEQEQYKTSTRDIGRVTLLKVANEKTGHLLCKLQVVEETREVKRSKIRLKDRGERKKER